MKILTLVFSISSSYAIDISISFNNPSINISYGVSLILELKITYYIYE